jgi:hypothetical protein
MAMTRGQIGVEITPEMATQAIAIAERSVGPAWERP